MRIMLVTSKLNFVSAGGSVADLHLKAKGLVELGHQVSVVTGFSEGNKINQALPYTVYEEYINSAHLLTIQYHVYRILKKYAANADAFYLDGHIFLYGAGWYRLVGGKPTVAFFNIRLNCWGDTQDTDKRRDNFFLRMKRGLRSFLEHRLGVPLINRLDAFIFNTPMVEKLYLEWGFDKNKSSIIEDFVDTTAIREYRKGKEEVAAHQTKIPLTILCTGRMIPEKGFDLVIKAFAQLPDKEHFRLIMSGGGPDQERLIGLTREFRLEKFITFPGWVNKEKLTNFFREAHIFIFPKWWIEYGSAVLTEAMAYGVPSIIPAGGALEWLSKGAALFFSQDNVAELVRQIECLGSDTTLRIQLSAGALQRADVLDYKKLAGRLDAVIRSARC